MLTFNTNSIRTRNLVLLFILISTFFFANNSFAGAWKADQTKGSGFIAKLAVFGTTDRFSLLSDDTVKTKKIQDSQSPVQDETNDDQSQLSQRAINFQINSDITYLSIKNFVNEEARNAFLQAWQKEHEAASLSAENDSLRKVYARSSEDRKQELANIILKNESKTIALNEEIPVLYQQARQIENIYWQNASETQIKSFQEKITHAKDSLQQVSNQVQLQQPVSSVPDTIIITNPDVSIPEPVNTQASGVVYKIQIAAAKYKLPSSTDKLIKKLSIIRQIENYKDEKGVTIYTTGNLKTWQEAVTMQKQVKQEGVRNPEVIAFKDGKKIAVNEARKITNEL